MPNATAGCYSNGFGAAPNGYIWAPLTYGSVQGLGDRETVANLHFGIPHKNDGLRDDIQVLGSLSYLFESFKTRITLLAQCGELLQHGRVEFIMVQRIPRVPVLARREYPCVFSELGIGPAGGFSAPGSPIGFQYRPTTSTRGRRAARSRLQISAKCSNIRSVPTERHRLWRHGWTERFGRENINDAIFKFQYTHAMGTNAYARMYVYSLYSDC